MLTHSRPSPLATTLHWSRAQRQYPIWANNTWPNFSPEELACKHCGEYYHWPEFLHRLQWVRTQIAHPIQINSAHRCSRHNAHIGGAPLSQHKKLAVDIHLRSHDRLALKQTCEQAGFTGFGLYQTFLHIDLGRARTWFGAGAKPLWQ